MYVIVMVINKDYKLEYGHGLAEKQGLFYAQKQIENSFSVKDNPQ